MGTTSRQEAHMRQTGRFEFLPPPASNSPSDPFYLQSQTGMAEQKCSGLSSGSTVNKQSTDGGLEAERQILTIAIEIAHVCCIYMYMTENLYLY